MGSDFSVQRDKMVEGQLRTTDVTDRPLLDAMAEIPRESFVPRKLVPLAYIDEDLSLGEGENGTPRYLMEPSPFARLVQLAQVTPQDFVLDVGCATGYSAAVLSRVASSVAALECDARLAANAGETLSRLGFDNVAVIEGPLEDGLPDQAPFDVIVVEGAVDEIPQALFDQLREGGRLVTVVGQGNAGVATIYLRAGGTISARRAFNAAVKPLPGFAKEPQFEF